LIKDDSVTKTKSETDVNETDEKSKDDWFSMKTSSVKRASSAKKASFAKKVNDSKETASTSMMSMTFVYLCLISYLSCLNDWLIRLSMIDLTRRLMIEVDEWERKHLTALFVDEERTCERTVDFLSIDLDIKHQAKN